METDDRPRIWGYASKEPEEDDVKGVRVQIARIQDKARELDGVWCGCRIEHELDAQLPYRDRPQLKCLFDELCRGDHLILWRLDRLDGNIFALIKALRFLVNRKIYIHVLEEYGGLQIDINQDAGHGMLTVFDITAELVRQKWRRSTRRGIRRRKACGLAVGRLPSIGKKRIRTKDGAAMDVWDEAECRQIREIKARVDSGESMTKIAKDFHERRERTASGSLWVKPYGRKRRLNSTRLSRAYRFYTDLLAQGEDLGGLPAITPPGLFDGDSSAACGDVSARR
jgi:DNA invertase Pin-like site-specific DNA recombinase